MSEKLPTNHNRRPKRSVREWSWSITVALAVATLAPQPSRADPVTALAAAGTLVGMFSKPTDVNLAVAMEVYRLQGATLQRLTGIENALFQTLYEIEEIPGANAELVGDKLDQRTIAQILAATSHLNTKFADGILEPFEREELEQHSAEYVLLADSLEAGNQVLTGPAVALFPFVRLAYIEALSASEESLEAHREAERRRLAAFLNATGPGSLPEVLAELEKVQKALLLQEKVPSAVREAVAQLTEDATSLGEDQGSERRVQLDGVAVYELKSERFRVPPPVGTGDLLYPEYRESYDEKFKHNICSYVRVKACHIERGLFSLAIEADGSQVHCGSDQSAKAFDNKGTKAGLERELINAVNDIELQFGYYNKVSEAVLVGVHRMRDLIDEALELIESYEPQRAAKYMLAKARSVDSIRLIRDAADLADKAAAEALVDDIRRRREESERILRAGEERIAAAQKAAEDAASINQVASLPRVSAQLIGFARQLSAWLEELEPNVQAPVPAPVLEGSGMNADGRWGILTRGEAWTGEDTRRLRLLAVQNPRALLERGVELAELLITMPVGVDHDRMEFEALEMIPLLLDPAQPRGDDDDVRTSTSEPAVSAVVGEFIELVPKKLAIVGSILLPSEANAPTYDPEHAARVSVAQHLGAALAQRGVKRAEAFSREN